MIRAVYQLTDFNFAITYIDSLHIFYVIPVQDFIAYGSEIHLVESDKQQRKPRSAVYREAWHLMSQPAENLLVRDEPTDSEVAALAS